MNESDGYPEYVWHFKLSSDGESARDGDALAEMVRDQVTALLQCVVFTSGGVDLKVTGFRFLDEPDREHAILPKLPTRQPSDDSETSPE
jgi:hypothetical protein